MENLDNTVKLSDAIVPFPTDPLPNAAEIREIKSLSQDETLNYLPQSATHDVLKLIAVAFDVFDRSLLGMNISHEHAGEFRGKWGSKLSVPR